MEVSGPDLALLPEDETGCILVGTGSYDPHTTPLDADGQGIPYETYGFGAQIAEVDVDLELGHDGRPPDRRRARRRSRRQPDARRGPDPRRDRPGARAWR